MSTLPVEVYQRGDALTSLVFRVKIKPSTVIRNPDAGYIMDALERQGLNVESVEMEAAAR